MASMTGRSPSAHFLDLINWHPGVVACDSILPLADGVKRMLGGCFHMGI